MTDGFEPGDAANPMEIAADWVDELATLTPQRQEVLRMWLQASDENAAAFARMQKMMTDVSLLEALESERAQRSPLFESRPRRAVQARARSPGRLGRRGLPLIGAGIGAAAAAAALAMFILPALRPPVGPAPVQTYATTIGERSDVTLADRSVMHLSADTRVAVTYSGSGRDVRLERGEAMFDVAHDVAHPFSVAAGAVTVTDVGTVFDVERIADAAEVRVFRGAVTVAIPGSPTRSLQKGEWMTLDPRRSAVQGRFDPVAYQTWRTDWLQAENMPLKYAIARLNRYSARRISLDDASKADVTLTGRFDLRSTDATLEMIAVLLKMKAVRRGDQLHLQSAGAN